VTEEQSLTIAEAIEQIKQKMREVSPNYIKRIMRKMKLTRITNIAIERMIACLALHHFGLPITTNWLAILLDLDEKKWPGLSSFLHGLGDKNCLILKRGTKTKGYQWIVHPIFWKYFHEGWDEEELWV